MKSPLDSQPFVIQLREAVRNELYDLMSNPSKSVTHPEDAELIIQAVKCGIPIPRFYRDNQNILDTVAKIGVMFYLDQEECHRLLDILFGKNTT
jgi:hypothetical protein